MSADLGRVISFDAETVVVMNYDGWEHSYVPQFVSRNLPSEPPGFGMFAFETKEERDRILVEWNEQQERRAEEWRQAMKNKKAKEESIWNEVQVGNL